MRHPVICRLAVLAALTSACGAAQPASQSNALGPTRALGQIAVQAPTSWVESPPSSRARRAQWAIGSGEATAELVVYHFGSNGAGSIDANLERWFGQFEQPDGRPSKEVARVSERTVAGLSITQVDLGGRYVAAIRPGQAERHDRPDWHMLAAIVLSSDGAYYFKLVGPGATVIGARGGFDAMLGSLAKVEPGASTPPAAPHPQ